MPAAETPSFDQAFAALRQFARSRRPAERCELCSADLAHEHPHLVEISLRQIVCACEACATLFDGMANGKYRRVSRRAQFLANFQMTDAQWENLLIPINMAFFFHSSVEGKVVALYPSPAGAVESLPSTGCLERDRAGESNPEPVATRHRGVARQPGGSRARIVPGRILHCPYR